MAFRKFAIGAAQSSSEATDPVISTTDFHLFTINPASMNQQHTRGQLVRVLSGAPRVTTTQTPVEQFSLRWQKISSATKQDEMDDYFLRSTKLVFINDQNYAWEVIVVPNSYKANRRRSSKSDVETYECEVTLMSLGSGKQLTALDTGYVTPTG